MNREINKSMDCPHDETKETLNDRIRQWNYEVESFTHRIPMLCWFVWIIIGFGFLFLALGIGRLEKLFPDDYLTWSRIGDFLSGTAGALFTLAGFLAVYIGFLVQQKQFASQQEQIARAGLETIRNRESLGDQVAKQNLLQLITLYNDLVKQLELQTNAGSSMKGRKCFYKLYENFAESLPANSQLSDIEEKLSKFLDINWEIINQPLQHLISIMESLDDLSDRTIDCATVLVRSQVSDPEMCLLAYFSLGESQKALHIKSIIEKYGFLKDTIRPGLVKQTHESWFSPSAFGLPSEEPAKSSK